MAINGVGLGIGCTIIGFADLAFMSTAARLKCPFTSLGVAPEAASSYLMPLLVGRQNAAWLLQSAEWVSAEEAKEMGLVWRVCEPDDLLAEATKHAEVLACPADREPGRGQADDDRAAPRRDRGRPRARERGLRRAAWAGRPTSRRSSAFAEGREPDFSDL